jgi:diguanylate cyclase (GGDEF)-like protein
LATLLSPPPEVPGPLHLGDHLAHMRHRLVDRVYKAAGLLALLYVPLLVWRVADVGWHRQLQVHAGLIGFTLLVVALLPRLALRWKSGLLVGSFLVLGLFGIFTMGMMGTGYWWCLQAAVLVATLVSVRAGAALALACAALLLTVGVFFVGGTLAPPFDLNQHARSPSAWGAFLMVVLFAPLALLLALGSYQATVAQLVEQVNQQRLQLARQVGHDTLTGLPLLPLAVDRLDMALKQARRSGRRVALLFVDLDGFKAVNDQHGHAAGDHVLQQVALRLQRALRDEDTVARVGGDEFVIVLGHLAEAQPAARLAAELNADLAQPIAWQGRTLHVAASIGIALFPDHGADAESLRRLADAAMYGVKKAGRNGYAFAGSSPSR